MKGVYLIFLDGDEAGLIADYFKDHGQKYVADVIDMKKFMLGELKKIFGVEDFKKSPQSVKAHHVSLFYSRLGCGVFAVTDYVGKVLPNDDDAFTYFARILEKECPSGWLGKKLIDLLGNTNGVYGVLNCSVKDMRAARTGAKTIMITTSKAKLEESDGFGLDEVNEETILSAQAKIAGIWFPKKTPTAEETKAKKRGNPKKGNK